MAIDLWKNKNIMICERIWGIFLILNSLNNELPWKQSNNAEGAFLRDEALLLCIKIKGN